MRLTPPPKVGKLPEAVPAQAPKAPTDRCEAWYDQVDRMDGRGHADRCGRANGGTAGVDGQTCAGVQAYDPRKWPGDAADERRTT